MLVPGGLLTPISALSLLMILAGSYGTASTDLRGFLTVVVAPPTAGVTGLGLLWRKSWSWYTALALLGLALVVLGQQGSTTAPVAVVVCLLLIVRLCSSAVRAELGVVLRAPTAGTGGMNVPQSPLEGPEPSAPRGSMTDRDWRTGHTGRDQMYYEERHAGSWCRITIDGEMLMGRAHHVIYFATPEQWQHYPEWARGRRDEIISRITSEFRQPDYEYQSGGKALSARRPPAASTDASTARSNRALAFFIVFLLAVAGGSGWLVRNGLTSEQTWLPSPRASQTRIVSRNQEPSTFWLAIGVYASAGLGTGALALWCLREAWRIQPRRH